jgi:hypothetical protein
MNSVGSHLLLPISALFEAQIEMDKRLISDLQHHSSLRYPIVIDDNIIQIPHLLLTNVRSTVVTSARITIDLHSTMIRTIQKSASVTLNIDTESRADLRDMLLDQGNGSIVSRVDIESEGLVVPEPTTS